MSESGSLDAEVRRVDAALALRHRRCVAVGVEMSTKRRGEESLERLNSRTQRVVAPVFEALLVGFSTLILPLEFLTRVEDDVEVSPIDGELAWSSEDAFAAFARRCVSPDEMGETGEGRE